MSITPGAVLELIAAKANGGTGPGVNTPSFLTDWHDTSGNSNDGTLTGMAGTTASGWAGSGTTSDPYRLVFDGVDDYVSVADAAALNFGTGAFTVECWAKLSDTAGVFGALLSKENPAGPYQGWALLPYDNTIRFYIQGLTSGRVYNTDAYSSGVMCHIVATFDGTDEEIYLDGVPSAHSLGAQSGPYNTDTTDPLRVSSRNLSSFYEANGIAVARIYPFALTADQVAQNFAEGVATYLDVEAMVIDVPVPDISVVATLLEDVEPLTIDVPVPGLSVVAIAINYANVEPMTIDVPVPDLAVVADQIEWVYDDAGPITVQLPGAPDVEVGAPTQDTPTTAPAALAGYATGITIQLTTQDGLVVDVGPLHENLQTSRARKFGFEAASWEMPSYSVKRNYPELQAMTDVLVVRDGVTVFEGRITDPGVQLTETDARRMVTCRGYCDGLSDDETVRRMYADSDPSAWRSFMPAPAHDFGVSASATGLVAQAKWGSTYASDAWGGLCYRIFGGIMSGKKVTALKAHYHWNGKLDPKLITTAETPGYNFFPDPRNLSGSQVWQINDTDVQVGPVTAQKMTTPDGSTWINEARCFLWDARTWESALGFEYWNCSMALPSDVQADAQITNGTTILVSMFTAGTNDGDSMALLCRDANGNVLNWTSVSLSADESWEWKDLFVEAPAETTELLLMMGMAVGGTAWRRVCFPLVSNYKPGVDDSYHDGLSQGWEWISGANNSPSRETDLSVTERVFALLKSYNHGDPIYATIFAADDPDGVAKELAQGGKQAVAYQVLHEWHSNAKSSGDISLDVGRYGVGLRIGTTSMQASISAMPPALTFNPPATGNSPEPYGLTLSNLILIGEGTSVIDAIKHLARGYVASARQLVFDEDPANVTFNQLVFADATTDAAILQSLDAMLDWEYGFEDKGRFYYANPALIAADPRRVYQIPYSLAAPSLTRQIDDVCNGVEVSWTQKDGTQAAITVTRQSPCLPKGMRKIHEVAMSQPGQRNKSCDMSAAKALAKAYLDQHTKPQITGQMPLTGRLVQDGTGAWRSVLSIMEGEYVRLTEAPPEEQDDGLLLITRVSIDHTTLQTTLEVGMNRKRLDRLLARMDATIVRR